ncbi:MAG: M14 family zinc carboxypeptidase [Gemmatimonadales bacterium]
MRYRRLSSLALSLCAVLPLGAQQTVPERTGGARTSSHAEVLAFLDSLTHRGAKMQVGTLGSSPQGKRLPYVILSRPLVTTPAAAKKSGKPVLYIQANIHAGEVEGKEAVQQLMRDLTLGKLRPLLDSVVIIFVPMYNADGNDAWGPQERNRSEQNGPALVGLRPNGQGYDLNRDYVKQDAPETRASLTLINAWDPDLFMDLHTTDGSYHGYALTWSPGLNANRTPSNGWVQDTVLEQVRKRVRDRFKFETYPYGNFRGGNANPTGWDTYESLPRYGTNLNGMTRFSILSEAMSHDVFPRRIDATYAFVLETIRFFVEHKREMQRHRMLTANWRPDSVIVRGNVLASSPARMDSVLVAITRTEQLPAPDSAAMANAPRPLVIAEPVGCTATGTAAPAGPPRGAGRPAAAPGPRSEVFLTGESRPVWMEVHDRFGAVRKEAMPAAYLFQDSKVAELLERQGVLVKRLRRDWVGPVESFVVDTVIRAPRANEGHCGVRVEGRWTQAAADSAKFSSFLVTTNQRFGLLAAFLLEPASEDGYTTWNFFDRDLVPHATHPVRRVRVLPPSLRIAAP